MFSSAITHAISTKVILTVGAHLLPPTNFTLSLDDDGYGYSNTFNVHDWILFARWEYFRVMYLNGKDLFSEMINRAITLPSTDFTPSMLNTLVKLIYCDVVDCNYDDIARLRDLNEQYKFGTLLCVTC